MDNSTLLQLLALSFTMFSLLTSVSSLQANPPVDSRVGRFNNKEVKDITITDLVVFPVPEFYIRGANSYQDVLDATRNILTIPIGERCYYRYLSFYNLPLPRVVDLSNSISQAERMAFREYVLRYHLNLLSRLPEFAFGEWVYPDKETEDKRLSTLLRIDLREYGIDHEVWDKSADIDPYFHYYNYDNPSNSSKEPKYKIYGYWQGPSGVNDWLPARVFTDQQALDRGYWWVTTRKEPVQSTNTVSTLSPWLPGIPAKVLVYWTQSKSPILKADWFFISTSRQFSLRNDEKNGFGYYDLLGIKSRKDWFDLVRLDEKLAIRAFKEIRAVVDSSGVSAQNRQIVRLGSINGGIWGTLDVFDEHDRGIAKQNLKRDEFRHDAEEWFGPLDNGLPSTLASSTKGELQSNAPDKIGPNDSPRRKGHDGRIHVNLACMQCHSSKEVLQPIRDFIRSTYTFDSNGGKYVLGATDKYTDLYLKRLYFSDLQGKLKHDNREYAEATWRCVHTTPETIADLYSNAFYRYSLDKIGLDIGAEELGVSRDHFLNALKTINDPKKSIGRVGSILLGFLKTPDYKVTRLEWEFVYSSAAILVAGYVPKDNDQ